MKRFSDKAFVGLAVIFCVVLLLFSGCTLPYSKPTEGVWQNEELHVLVDFGALNTRENRCGILLKDGVPDSVVEAGFGITQHFFLQSYGEQTVLLEGSCVFQDGVFTVEADRTGKKYAFTRMADEEVAGIAVTRRSTDVSTAFDTIFISLQLHHQQLLDPTFLNDPTTRILPAIVPRNNRNSGIVVYYFDQYKIGLPLGGDLQTVLSIQYEKKAFEKETQRLSQITNAKPILYDNTHFSLSAYVTALNWEGCSEYVLVDEQTLTLHYVYLQNNTAPLEIPERFLPRTADIEPFSICESD